MKIKTAVRTRIAPSPTGEFHIGHMRSCLYSYALAKKFGGQFVVRIEDTDQKRFVPGSQDRTLQVIKEYGLQWDEGPDVGGPFGPYTQTKRLDIYQKHAEILLQKGHAYRCFCTEDRLKEMRSLQKQKGISPKYDRFCLGLTNDEINKRLGNNEKYVIRMRVPDNQSVEFVDKVRGLIKIRTEEIDDQVLIKSDGIPTYHFAVVIDDHLMEISHVLRGEEWITSTPKQILLYQFFGWQKPTFVHLTVLLDPSGLGKMSKRKGSVSARSFLEEGYLPEALLNFLMLLGWNPGDNREIFSLDEFVEIFSLERLHKKSPVFDRKKLDYLNGYYIRKKDETELCQHFQKFLPQASEEQVKILVPVLKDRLVKFGDLPTMMKFLFENVSYDRSLLLKYKNEKLEEEMVKEMLLSARKVVETSEGFETNMLKEEFERMLSLCPWKDENNYVGKFYMVLRVAICGLVFTPPVIECLPALGRKKTLEKIDLALSLLN